MGAKEIRIHSFNVRLTPTERVRLQEGANKKGHTPSAFIRYVVFKALEKQKHKGTENEK